MLDSCELLADGVAALVIDDSGDMYWLAFCCWRFGSGAEVSSISCCWISAMKLELKCDCCRITGLSFGRQTDFSWI